MAHIINKQVLDQFNILILYKDLKTIQNLFSWKTCQIIFENFDSFALFDDVSKKAKIRSMLQEKKIFALFFANLEHNECSCII